MRPLHHATVVNSLPLVRKLLRAGARVNAKDADGESVLFLAVVLNRERIVFTLFFESLVENVDTRYGRGINGVTPLHRAVMDRRYGCNPLIRPGFQLLGGKSLEAFLR
jgi:ankyrin repeat protein